VEVTGTIRGVSDLIAYPVNWLAEMRIVSASATSGEGAGSDDGIAGVAATLNGAVGASSGGIGAAGDISVRAIGYTVGGAEMRWMRCVGVSSLFAESEGSLIALLRLPSSSLGHYPEREI